MASDGRWYPPDLHPSRTTAPDIPADPTPAPLPTTAAIPAASIVVPPEARPGALPPFDPAVYRAVPAYPEALPPVVPPFGQPPAAANSSPSTGFVQQSVWAVTGHGTAPPGAAAPSGWGTAPGWGNTHVLGRRAGSRAIRRTAVDVRGILTAVASLVVLVAALQPWYAVRVIAASGSNVSLNQMFHFTLSSSAYGGWRLLLPILCAFAALIGIMDAVLRSGDRGAVGVFVALRIVTVCELVLVIACIAVRTPALPLNLGLPQSVETVVEVTPAAWVALVAGAIAFFSTLASLNSDH
jgi:hypothetical protein